MNFCALLLSLNITSVRCIHIIVCSHLIHFYCSLVFCYVMIPQSIHSPLDKADSNALMYVFYWAWMHFLLGTYYEWNHWAIELKTDFNSVHLSMCELARVTFGYK